jgi:rhamnose utilization protein RhaD (predicted bifunctional aldolase and dehydrogenase)
MRKNNWNEADANAWVEKAGTHDADIQLALRVYTSRLIGNDPDLVMHGGGNTSVKVKRKDIFGNEIDVLHVKGSGWDLDTIEAAGLPGVKMEPLHALRQLDQLSDEDMVNIQRANLIDTSSPNPSVETLLHAYLTHRFVDHTHATAFLALANLPDAEAIMHEIFGDTIIAIPYIMPGFELAKKAADMFDANPDCEGMLLLNHGHFTFGDTAKESYDRIIDHTNRVEEWFKTKTSGRSFSTSVHQDRSIKPTGSMPTFLNKLRGEIDHIRTQHHDGAVKSSVFDIRTSQQIDEFLKRSDLNVLRSRGVGSPDHVIRTKGKMLYFTQSELNSDHGIVGKKISDYVEDYNQIFQAQNKRVGGHKVMIEPHPVVVWVEGLGIIGIGKDAKAASAHADIAEQTIEVISLGEAAGGYFPIGADDNFDMVPRTSKIVKIKRQSLYRASGCNNRGRRCNRFGHRQSLYQRRCKHCPH